MLRLSVLLQLHSQSSSFPAVVGTAGTIVVLPYLEQNPRLLIPLNITCLQLFSIGMRVSFLIL